MTGSNVFPLPGMKFKSSTAGGEWCGPCPSCGGTDRFVAWPEHPSGKARWMCRGCGKSGDAIDFLVQFEGMGYPEACAKLGVHVEPVRSSTPHEPIPPAWEPAPFVGPGDQWRTAARAFLRTLPLAFDYGHERGLTEATVKTLGLRWCDRDRYFTRHEWGLSEEINPATGRPRKVWVPHGMVIPNVRDGRGIGLKIRRADPGDGAKYVMVSGSAKASFVLPGGQHAVVVVESELDAALIWQEARDLCTALALGTARGKPDAGAAGLLKAAPLILVALDFDKAGAEGWPWWRQHFPQARRWPTPNGKDPGDFLKAGGDIHEWIVAGLPRQRHETAPRLTPEHLADTSTMPSQQAASAASLDDSRALSCRRRLTPPTLRNFKAGCAWLRPKLADLLAAGWTAKELFAVGRLTFPWGWAIAWTSSWTDPARTPTLQPDGTIRWEIREAVRTIYVANRPRPGRRAA